MNGLYVMTAGKLGNSQHWMRVAACAATAAFLGACASTPTDPVSEKLDPDTATTVTTLSRPIELLLSQNTRAKVNDPFAYIAPFETNRMGERDLFLWVSAPQVQGTLTQPQVLCDGQPLSLQPLGGDAVPVGASAAHATTGTPAKGAPPKMDLSQLNLSRAPYDAPVPWSTQWYFRLPQDSLKCLAGAGGISLKAQAPTGDAEQFIANRKNLASLDAFTRR